jgi:hypothetical protein
MSKKKGTSFEEKKRILLDAFQESRDVFNAKEAEKLAEKKGIRGPVAKEVLKALTDDSLVDTEKVGGSNYYWSFPNKEANLKKLQLDDMKRKWKKESERQLELKAKLDERTGSEPDAEERRIAEERLEELRVKKEDLLKQLQKYKDCDPDVLERMKEDVEVAKEAVERWTHGVFAIKKFVKDKFQMEESDFNLNFGIPKDFDYLD